MASDAGTLWLDTRRRYQLFLDPQGEFQGLKVDGEPQAACRVEDLPAAGGSSGAEAAPAGVAIAPASLSLQEIIQLCRSTGHPVLLAEERRILGVCGETEIIRALAGSRASRATAGGRRGALRSGIWLKYNDQDNITADRAG